MNSIYPMPVTIMLHPHHDDFGTRYIPANTLAVKLAKWKGRYFNDTDLGDLEDMGFVVIFPNGKPALPYPHHTKEARQSTVNIEA